MKDATRIRIAGDFSGCGYYTEATRHQFREKNNYGPREALLTYLSNIRYPMHGSGDGKGWSAGDPQQSEGAGGYRNRNPRLIFRVE